MEHRLVDWSDEYGEGTWEFIGAHLIYERERERLENCPHDTSDYCRECDIYPDDMQSENYPMMNYAYPTRLSDIEDDTILYICDHTCLTVVYNTKEDEYYLALTGGGMDLSQSIALAYIRLYQMEYDSEGWIPFDMLTDISSQPMLSTSREEWLLVADRVIDGLNNQIARLQQRMETWEREKANVEQEAD